PAPDERLFMHTGPPDDTRVRQARFVEDHCAFDADAFGMGAREAEELDPQLRVALEVAWDALEDAGCGGAGQEARAGVFLGVTTNDYADLVREAGMDRPGSFALGNSHGLFAARLSHVLGLKGPSMAINSVCASSGIAFNEAVLALRQGACDIALVGGVNAILSDFVNCDLGGLGIISRKGRCAPFDAQADGYVRGEGCGFLILEGRARAKERGHREIATVAGLGMGHDGDGQILSPNRRALAAAMQAALKDAGLEPGAVSHLEAGSIGAPLADAIEAAALADVFGHARPAPLVIGSVKPHIGHLEAASGVAALTSAALQLSKGRPAASPERLDVNPHIAWDESEITLEAGAGEAVPSVIGVNTVSLSGTNVHILLGRAEPRTAQAAMVKSFPILFSARSPEGLCQMAAALATELEAHPETLCDMAFTLMAGRTMLAHRGAVIASDAAAAIAALRAFVPSEPVGEPMGEPVGAEQTRLAFADQAPDLPPMPETLRARQSALEAWAAIAGQAREADAESFAAQAATAATMRALGCAPGEASGQGGGLLAAALFAEKLSLADAARLAHDLEDEARDNVRLETGTLPLSPRVETFGDLRCAMLSGLEAAPGIPLTGTLSDIAARAFETGLRLDWGKLAALFGGARIALPLPRFERKAHWPRALIERFGRAEARQDAAPEPYLSEEEAERLLTVILVQEIGFLPSGPGQSLIDIGASSLEMLRALSRMREEMRFEPDLDAFLLDPSVSGLLSQYRAAQEAQTPDIEETEEGWI
ncbi:MAG: beta-ketoacyl synthase N-terminal-like domain-containing protein, partial [Pseudomonadota bacterium]